MHLDAEPGERALNGGGKRLGNLVHLGSLIARAWLARIFHNTCMRVPEL
jgi:hypothetical protein